MRVGLGCGGGVVDWVEIGVLSQQPIWIRWSSVKVVCERERERAMW